MTSAADQAATLTPQKPIRRFDVFAEYTRQELLAKGEPPEVAKGYGVWLAKVVAARRFGRKAERADREAAGRHREETPETPRFRTLDDELQTDEMFDHDIVDRMGSTFYESVFVPAITEARAQGASYERIRDTIRKDWKSARPAGR